MFYEFYYTDQHEEPIYCSIITEDENHEASLYIGNKLVKRQSVKKGVHVLKKDDVILNLVMHRFSTAPALKINNESVELPKVKRKEIKAKLTALGIHNEINPRPEPKEPFKISSIIVPLIIIGIGIGLQLLTRNMHKFWQIPSMILMVIAYFQLSSPLINKIPNRFLDTATSGKFKLIFGIAGMALTQDLIHKVIN